MKEHPILFSGEMVRAILDGRKTQTRRVIKPQPVCDSVVKHGEEWLISYEGCCVEDINKKLRCPYGAPKDCLWVREKFQYVKPATDNERYRDKEKWRPSIHMPRWASRITLEIKDIRVERVQDITATDCMKEGVVYQSKSYEMSCFTAGERDRRRAEDFRKLWDSINAKRGFGWDANPWVWVIEFARCK